MSSKDCYEQLTKEGCSRVVVFNLTGVICSYTLECGYHVTSEVENGPSSYMDIGKNVIESIDDFFFEKHGDINKIRVETAVETSRIDRFRLYCQIK